MFKCSRSVQMLHNVKKNNIDLFEVHAHISLFQIYVHVQLQIIIPPVYEVYRGYIVFVFSVTMFVGVFVGVCVCNFFFVKDFSGTTEPRILKFGTNVGYKLYCVRENQPPPAYHSLYLSIFLSLQ